MDGGERVSRVFKAYDLRGLVPEELDGELARAAGIAFARFAGAREIVVGRDMRTSGEELSRAFTAGVTSEGASVIDIGLASTDLLYFASGVRNVPGAMFTASHNPAHYNGIKLCLAGARPVGQDTGLAAIAATTASLLDAGGGVPEEHPELVCREDYLDAFARHVRSFIGAAAHRGLRPLHVVADTANGMGGLVAPRVFEDLPFEVDVLYGELDGTFPNHPADPIQPENLRDLIHAVRERGADVGLAFDGDADRVFLVDDRGVPLPGSTTTAIVAAEMLRRHPGATVLHNLICSKSVPEVIAESGGTALRTRVGHSFIKAAMAETGAVFGGEHSGHYYFRDNYNADSGIIAALVVLGVMCDEGVTLSELRRPYERYAASGERNRSVANAPEVLDALEAELARSGGTTDRLDGLTADFGEWWCNVRPSNTEPLLRLNVEGPDAASVAGRVAEIEGLIDGISAGTGQDGGGGEATGGARESAGAAAVPAGDVQGSPEARR